ncbi:MAG: hypothetical protein KA327_06810 [Pseudarcicella sp.]|jgi:hypothetical protein|nr:hypothetical protein [Pseudarcicella sp.]
MKNLKKISVSVFGLSVLLLSLCMSNCKDETPKANVIKDTSKVVNDCKSCVEIKPVFDSSLQVLQVSGVLDQFIKQKFKVIRLSKDSDSWFLRSESMQESYIIQCKLPENIYVEGKQIIIDATTYSLYIPGNVKLYSSRSICVSKIY